MKFVAAITIQLFHVQSQNMTKSLVGTCVADRFPMQHERINQYDSSRSQWFAMFG